MNNPFLDMLDSAQKSETHDCCTLPHAEAANGASPGAAPVDENGAQPAAHIENPEGASTSTTATTTTASPAKAPAQSHDQPEPEPVSASASGGIVQQSASAHAIAPDSGAQSSPPSGRSAEQPEAPPSESPKADVGNAASASRSSSSHGLIPPPPKPQPRVASDESGDSSNVATSGVDQNAEAAAREAETDAEFAAKKVEGFDPGFESKFEKAASPTHSPPATDSAAAAGSVSIGADSAGASAPGGEGEGDSSNANATANAAWDSEASKAVMAEAASEAAAVPEEPEVFEPFRKEAEGMNEWRLMMRYPEKKKFGGTRAWRNVIVRLEANAQGLPVLRVSFDGDARVYREVALEPSMQLSKELTQQLDSLGKVHIIRLSTVTYKEMVGMKAEKMMSVKYLSNLITKPKGTHVLDHIPFSEDVFKFGSLDVATLRSWAERLEEALMRLECIRLMSASYSKEECYCYVRDEYVGVCDSNARIIEQRARVRVFFLAFVTGMPICELGINERSREGLEVVRRQDILPVMHNEWIALHEPAFHSVVQLDEYARSRLIRFTPPDGLKIELFRARVSLRNSRELPLQAKCVYAIGPNSVLIRCDLIVPGFFRYRTHIILVHLLLKSSID